MVAHVTNNLNIKHLLCHLAFNHDMIFCCAVASDWDNINKECQQLVTAYNQKENKCCLEKHCSPGDRVLIVCSQ
jgi:hypothetical protein